ncbi:xanthine dehydrogenase family protein molybdopterin-binding subunit [soil metagenome]
MGYVGQNVQRKDSQAKVSGAAVYADDLKFPGMLYGRTIRSEIPAGRITGISHDLEPDGYTVVTADDIPGRNAIELIEFDQPCLATGRVNHVAEPILLIAHADRSALWRARVDVSYEPEEPLYDPKQSGRIFKDVCITKGDLDAGFAAADVVVEGEYRTGHQEQLYIETNGVIAVPENGGITLYGSMQCPFYVHKALQCLLDWPGERVRVVQTETGGGFGGKEDYPSMIAAHAALLALKSQRPVKLIYDRVEDMLATTKRHPAIIRHRTGVTRDGSITAMDIDILMDGGAYMTLSPVVLSRGAIHATGPYRCDNVRVAGRAVFTNTPPNGAFRGFGAPQTQFAAEVHIERVAETLRMDSVDFRRRNALRPGDTTATGQLLKDDCSALEVLERAIARSGYEIKRRQYRGTGRGIGLALFFHGAGFTGGGEVRLASRAAVELTRTGARVLVGSTEIGQGTRTMHAQIVADALGLPFDAIDVSPADTAVVPDSGPTVASRTCMVVGRILQRCAEEIRDRLGDLTPAEYIDSNGPLVVVKEYEGPSGIVWDDDTYRGDAYAAYAWACDVAEIEIDPDTFAVRPLHITAVQDVGKAIHPVLVAGQIEGGTAQGVGYALIEHVVMRDGAMANASLTNYTIPTTLDTPLIDVELVERPCDYGPFGAKGVGELPIDGPAPAIVNAIRHAGYDVRDIPVLPEHLETLACVSR